MKKYYKLHINNDAITSSCQAGRGAIVIKEVPDIYFMGYTNNWNLTGEDVKNLNLPNVKPGGNIVLKDKTIFRYSKLNLPRQKVDLLKDRENIKVTRKPENADIHIISYKFLGSLFNYRWEKAVPFKDFYHIIKDAMEDNLLTDECISEMRDFISNADKDSYVAVDKHYHYSSQPHQEKFNDDWNSIVKEFDHDYSRCIILEEKNAKMYQTFINTNAQIIFDTDVLDVIDADLAVLDNTQYKDIEAMITSNDRENRSLAVEMLANCNIEKSFDVVSGLYWWHYDWIKDTNNWNTVNVKALRSRMKAYEGGHNTTNVYAFNAYINALAKDNKLTRFAVDKTREKLMNTVLKSICGKDNSVFKVDLENLYIADEIESMINE